MTSYLKSMRILTVLAALTAGPAALASGATATSEPRSPGKGAEAKQAAGLEKGASKEHGHAEHASCVCAGLQAPPVPDYGG